MATKMLVYRLFIASILFSSPATSREVDDEHDFNYDSNSPRGPAHWGQLKLEWSTCGNGTMQSPIDIRPNREIEGVRIKKRYVRANSILKNRGHDIMLRWEGGGGWIYINGTEYQLLQIHWHSPSEHTVFGQRFDLEAHMVHESIDGRNITAVVGIFYKIDLPDPFLTSLEEKLSGITNLTGAEVVVGPTDPNEIKMESATYYSYNGSLTVPPCSENVLWTIPSQVMTVSRRQVTLLRVNGTDNARPLQQLNNRPVKVYYRLPLP